MNNSKKFALVGVAGYVAPRHLKAIKETNNELVAAYDPCDSVGIIDQYFPNAAFFTEFERFDRHLEKLRQNNQGIDFLSICSPNYLHDAHCRLGLRLEANVICEKPLVLNPWNLDALKSLENKYNKNIYSILQLRLHPEAKKLKDHVDRNKENYFEVDLSYITSRGMWYYSSWKSDMQKSGGIATNIGIHLFDLLTWLFGSPTTLEVHQNSHDRASGFIKFNNAEVKWFLSINSGTLPQESKHNGEKTFRKLRINNQEFDFSYGFENLHTKSYEQIIGGQGFEIKDCREAIALCAEIRNIEVLHHSENKHAFADIPESQHPFKRNLT